MRHHAGGDGACFAGVAAGSAAGFRRYAQIAGIYKFHVFGGFIQPFREDVLRQSAAIAKNGITRMDVRFFFCGEIFGRVALRCQRRRLRRNFRRGNRCSRAGRFSWDAWSLRPSASDR